MADGNSGDPLADRGDVDGVVNPTELFPGTGNGNRDGAAGADDSPPIRRRRGRPPGTSGAGGNTGRGAKAGAKTSATLDIDGVSALLVLIHHAVADRAGAHWAISSAEADSLAKAASNVIRHYDIAATQKMLDYGALITTACAIYLPRVVTQLNPAPASLEVPLPLAA